MKNFKATLALAAALVIFPGVAEAGKVYSASDGFWTMNGYLEGNEASCVLTAEYDDGSRVNFNLFPKLDGSQNITFTVKNMQWDNSGYQNGEDFTGEAYFRSKALGVLELKAHFQIYDKYTVIMRKVADEFADAFLAYDTLILFPKSESETTINLSGTENMSTNYSECLDAIFER